MSSKGLYNALPRQPKLTDQVVEKLIELIADGKLKPGERLPPERELAVEFDVSRTVIRESIRSLVARGLVEVRRGSGAFVSIPQTKLVAESMSLILQMGTTEDLYSQVFEVRRLLEVEIAGLAAERATPADIKEMEVQLELMENNCSVEQMAECDVEFHASLSRATHNEIYSVLLDSVVDIMLEIRHMALANPDAKRDAIEKHRMLYENVNKGDAESARKVMAEHLSTGERFMHSVATK